MADVINFNQGGNRRSFAKLRRDQLEKAGARVKVAQLEQLGNAFRNSGQPGRKWVPLWANEFVSEKGEKSFRAGGQPLRDTGQLMSSFIGVLSSVINNKIVSRVWTPIATAMMHQSGFKTTGPNYIPLSMKGRRLHVTGENPKIEGLEWNVDYFMAWQGVDVPQRKIIDYADSVNAKKINEAIKGV